MSHLTIGRAGFDVPIINVANFQARGEQLRISGRLLSRTIHSAQAVADAKILRQQLLGYDSNPDEEIIPITYDQDSTITGFYRVVGVEAEAESGSLIRVGAFPYTVELERVPGYAAPLFESILLGSYRNDSGHTPEVAFGSEITWHAVPGGALNYGVPISVTEEDRTADDGTVKWFYIVASPAPSYHTAKPRWICPPASWYQGAAKIEVGTTLRTVVGRQIENLPVNWRLSNGLIRIDPNSADLSIAHYDGTQWDTAKSFTVGIYDTTSVGDKHIPFSSAPKTVSVLRNSPEECIVRLTMPGQSGLLQDATVDLALRRGDRMVRITVQLYGQLGSNKTPSVWRTTAEAATTLNNGIRATSNDASSNRYVIAAAGIGGEDLSRGSMRSGLTAKGIFAIGSEIGGSAATGQATAQNLIQQYYAADTERVVVSGR